MIKILYVLTFSFFIVIPYNNVLRNDIIQFHNVPLFFGCSKYCKQIKLDFIVNETELDNSPLEKSVEKSFTYANWALASLAIILALFGIFSLVYFIIDRTNQLLIIRLKKELKDQRKEIEKMRKSLIQKQEFNYTAVEFNFQSMEYLSQMILSQNPKIDKNNHFLKIFNSTLLK